MANELNEFWKQPHLWPVTMPGYTFLASAVQQIGRARFPVSWRGDEPWIDVPPVLPEDQAKAGIAELRRAYALLERPVVFEVQRPRLVSPSPLKSILPQTPSRLCDDDWNDARTLALALAVPAAEKRSRWSDVMGITAAFFRMGALHCHLRAVAGGPYEGPIKPELWNTEDTSTRFGRCLMDLGNPFQQRAYVPHARIREASYSRQDFRLIFVEDRSLANCLEAVPKLSPPPELIADEIPAPSPTGPTQPRTLAYREQFKQFLREAVSANLEGPPDEWNRDRYIGEGRHRFRLPKDAAEKAYKEALSEVEGHDWSRTGPRPKAAGGES